jgi:hypothetical protein
MSNRLLGMEELAERQRRIKKPHGGVLFARNGDNEEKIAARQRIIDLFHPDRWPGPLSMLTMPSVMWRFERQLLDVREPGWKQAEHPQRTQFTSVEFEYNLFTAACHQMPGLGTSVAKEPQPYPFAERGLKTNYATLLFAAVEALMKNEWPNGWDAVWLDFTGKMSVERLAVIAEFYHRCVRDTLIITALKCRWNRKTTAAIAAAGGYAFWLNQHLYGQILHVIEYQDTSPMVQFAVRHHRRSCPVCGPAIREKANGT